MNGLPPEAAIWRVDGQQWTIRDELQAIQIERTDHWGLAQAYIHSNGKGLPKKPLEIPRPGHKQQEAEKVDRVVTDPREIAAWFSS